MLGLRALSASRIACTSSSAVDSGSPGSSPPLHLQRRAVGIAAQLVSALDDRRVQRAGADQRMRRPRLQRAIERSEPRQDAAEPQDRVLPVGRTAAVRRLPFDGDVDPRESLVADGDREVGRLGHDRRVGAPRLDERVGADARMLLVDDAGDDEPAGRQDRRARRSPSPPRSSRRRRPSCPARRGRRAGRRARPA